MTGFVSSVHGPVYIMVEWTDSFRHTAALASLSDPSLRPSTP